MPEPVVALGQLGQRWENLFGSTPALVGHDPDESDDGQQSDHQNEQILFGENVWAERDGQN